MTPDMAVVTPLNNFLGPEGDTVTVVTEKSQCHKAGGTHRTPLTEIEDRRACDSDRRVTVNNIQVILVCGRPGDRGSGTVFPDTVNFLFWLLFWCEWLCSQNNLTLRKSHVFLRYG